MQKIVVRERVFIPTDSVSIEDVDKYYTRKAYEESACAGCMYLTTRHCYTCDECSSYLGEVKMYREQTLGGIDYIGLPIGDKRLLERRLGIDYNDFKISDRRVLAEFEYKIKFTAQLRAYQEKLETSFMKKKYGLLEAPPRTGKTITMLKLCLNLGQKTLFLADQYEFITQFIDHIEGNEKEGIPKCTNLPELQKKYGKKLYGIPKTDEDYENFQIFTLPYQQFASKNGMARFNKIKHLIGTVAVDEVHSAAAPVFARVVSMFPARYKFGVTGTVKRKDKKHYVIKSVLGPVVAKTSIESMNVTVSVHETKVPTTKAKAWVFIMKHLCSNKERNKLIVDQVMRDLKAGRNIVIPIIFRNHALELQREINRRFGSKICELFVGGGGEKNKIDRKRILQQAKAGTTRVIVGIRRLLQRGLNVPQWDTIYEIIPISNEPNLKQETSRVRTPLDGKQSPIVRLFFDPNVGASMGCARSTLNHMKGFGYEMDKSTAPLMYKILSSGNKRQSIFDDETPVNLLDLEEKGMFTSL